MIGFLSGPYHADTEEGIQANIEKAKKTADYLRSEGYTIICPHTNFEYCKHLEKTEIGRQELIMMCMLLMDVCDVVFFMPGWRDSEGSRTEHGFAFSRGIERMYLTDLDCSV